MSKSFPKNVNDAVIVHCSRTPILRASKKNQESAPHLSTLISKVFTDCVQHLERYNKPASSIEDICVGNVLSPPSHLACFRMAALSCGIPTSTPIQVVNRQCASGLEAVNAIANAIINQQIEVGLAAGAESMSHHKMKDIGYPDVDWEVMKANKESMDCLLPMGITSENVSKTFQVDRVSMDKIAVKSHAKAYAAKTKYREEIVPIQTIDYDTGVRFNTNLETLAKLKPAFKKNGSTTAGNSSQVSDGAAAVLLMSRQKAKEFNLPILATFRACQTVGVPPKIMGIGPVYAIRALMNKSNLDLQHIDLFEINEAFASQFLYSIRELGLDENIVNVNGGALALGHPLGCTGARLVVSIVHELRRRKSYKNKDLLGVVSMCIGTGMGSAALVEVSHEDDAFTMSKL